MANETKPKGEPRMQPGVQREYRTDQIVIHWEPGLCIHEAECIRGLPSVFNSRARPWVNASGAEADEIATVIKRCPSGALRFERMDDGEQEVWLDGGRIEARPNGPLFVRGQIEFVDQDGSSRELPRAALCRCGHSANKPFCDNSHIRVGFNTED